MNPVPKKPAVLIVDDVPEDVKILGDILMGEYDVFIALSGPEAIKIVTSNEPPDIIFLDIIMEGMDGYEVCQELKNNPLVKDIPVIFLTAKDQQSDEARGFELGAVDYIKKPFDATIVRHRVRSQIQLKVYRERLESMVNQRTKELSKAFKKLSEEFTERKRSERALRESEKKYRRVFENIQDIYYEATLDGKILEISPSVKLQTRYTRSDLLGKSWQDLYVEPTERTVFVDRLMKEGKITDYEVLLKDKDGTQFYGAVSSIVVEDLRGKPSKLIGSIRNITPRKQAEIALIKSEERYRTIIESIEEGYYESDLHGNFTFVNDAVSKILGYSKEEVIGKNYKLFGSQASAVETFDAFNQVFNTNASSDIYDIEIIQKNSNRRQVEASVSPILDDHNHPIGFRGIIRDTTEKKERDRLTQSKMAAEAANHAKSEFLANMSHEIRTPMNAILGLTKLIQTTELNNKQKDYVNKIGSSTQTLLRLVNDILDFSKIEAGKLEMESANFNLDEVLRTLANMFALEASEKGIELILPILDDIPQYLIGDPVRLSQVLINLINNAIKFTDKGEIVVDIQFIERQFDRVKLKFTIKDSGTGIPVEKVDNMFNLFTQADGSISRRYGGTGLGLAICKKLVEMMDGEIGVTSSTAQGSIFYFTVFLGLQAKENSEIVISQARFSGLKALIVDDSKTTRFYLEKIITKFGFTVYCASSGEDAVRKCNEPDFPLDLIIMDWKMKGIDGIEAVRQIKTLPHRAQIPVIMLTAFGRENEIIKAEHAGIKFFLNKPISQSILFETITQLLKPSNKIEPIENIEDKKSPITYDELADKRILLVDDSKINLQVGFEILETFNLKVDTVTSGKKALELIQKNAYDCIFMDVQMPEMDGCETTLKIREWESFIIKGQDTSTLPANTRPQIPIIAMTAQAMKGDREKCIDAGMNDYITKPIDTDQLVEILLLWTT